MSLSSSLLLPKSRYPTQALSRKRVAHRYSILLLKYQPRLVPRCSRLYCSFETVSLVLRVGTNRNWAKGPWFYGPMFGSPSTSKRGTAPLVTRIQEAAEIKVASELKQWIGRAIKVKVDKTHKTIPLKKMTDSECFAKNVVKIGGDSGAA